MRSYALVVSPLARRGFVGDAHLSVASVVKTEEEIFGLPPLALNDLLASRHGRLLHRRSLRPSRTRPDERITHRSDFGPRLVGIADRASAGAPSS